MYTKWTISCKQSCDFKAAKFTQGRDYRIKDKFPSMVDDEETWYEIKGDVGMVQIPHSVLCEYFEV